MAITIQNSPSNGESLQDTLWHVVSSNHSSIPDFKYVFDVYVGGVQKIRVKQYPEPGTTYGYFDAGAIVRNSIEYGWFTPEASDQLLPANAWKLSYQVRYGEEYSGTTTLNLASGTTTAYNYRPDLFKRKTDLFSDYEDYFLTNRNTTIYADFNERFWIAFLYTRLGYKIYNQNNVKVDEDDNFYDAGAGQLAQFECKQLFNIANFYNAKYMEVIMYDVSGSPVGGKLTMYNKCNPKYETIPIHFMNRFGVFETLHFDLVSRLTMDVERKGYERRDFNINGSNVNYLTNTTYAESKINYSNKMNWTYRLTADAMSDTDYAWASQLINSPQIYMEVDDYFYPVTIKNTNYEYSKYVNNRQRPLEIDFEMNQTRYSHLR
jgi:hypothetical protein